MARRIGVGGWLHLSFRAMTTTLVLDDDTEGKSKEAPSGWFRNGKTGENGRRRTANSRQG